jgi:hypothetical protein
VAVEFSKKQAISRSTLESAITEAVKKSAPECKNFIGVIVERENPASQSESNWDVRGGAVWQIRAKKGWRCVEYNP